jgi:hypothetical protein
MNGKLAEFSFFTKCKLQIYCVMRNGSVVPIHRNIKLFLRKTTAYDTEISP